MSYNIAEYVVGYGFNGRHYGKTTADLSQRVFTLSTNEAIRIFDIENEGQGR